MCMYIYACLCVCVCVCELTTPCALSSAKVLRALLRALLYMCALLYALLLFELNWVQTTKV